MLVAKHMLDYYLFLNHKKSPQEIAFTSYFSHLSQQILYSSFLNDDNDLPM